MPPRESSCSTKARAAERAAVEGATREQSGVSPLADVESVPACEGAAAAEGVAAGAGVYAILDAERQLQYVGLAKNVAAHVRVHLQTLPQHTAFVQVGSMPGASAAELQAAWKAWIRQHGALPPGNQKGVTHWTVPAAAAAAAAAATTAERAVSDARPDARADAAVTAEVWRSLVVDGFAVIDDAVDAATVAAAAAGAEELRGARLMHCVSSQVVQGREDEVLVFNTADDAAGALVVGVGADTRQMNGEAMAGLTRVATMLKGLPHALHAQQHLAAARADGGGARWDMPSVAAPVSLMLAVYPADGAYYARHLDNDAADARARAGPPGQRVSDREVTAIVYLNEDWGSASEHGGYLRIHHPHDDGAQAYTDVAPHAGRLVLFQSRLVEHEVLPALRTRWAVSAWLPARAAFAVYDCV